MVADQADDPNFPEGGLAITPSFVKYAVYDKDGDHGWQQDTQEDIESFGIAGRVWEAAYVLTKYLSFPGTVNGGSSFDPPCSLFDTTDYGRQQHNVLELGAGVGVAGIHLALEVGKRAKAALERGETVDSSTRLILTDLENVLPLLSRNVKRAKLDDDTKSTSQYVNVDVRELAWGSRANVDSIENELRLSPSPSSSSSSSTTTTTTPPQAITHIVCSDLVYFPELLAPLLQTLLYLTRGQEAIEVIIGYKLRSYSKEEPFWKAFGVWFDFAPVLFKEDKTEWRRFGSRAVDCNQHLPGNEDGEAAAEDEMFVFVAQRKASTFDCVAPIEDERLLGGWLDKAGALVQGSGAETFELMLMNAIQG
ncbi:hypothetical protein CBS101457_002860 [Exobasidium rhododendri]|nr:hypothetical protein CBS101457_002860 [Exobasidium rhododendri]